MSQDKYAICSLTLSILVYVAQATFTVASNISTVEPKSSTTTTFYTYKDQIANEVDSNGFISSYLGRDVRSVINL